MFRQSLILISVLAFVGCNLPKGIHDEEPDYSAKVNSNFKDIEEWVITTRCVGCHNSIRHPKGVDLSTYNKIMNNDLFPPLVVPGKPEESSLYESVLKGRMPKSFRPLKQKELQSIYNWIKNGAKKTDLPAPIPDRRDPSEPGIGNGDSGEPGGTH